MAIAPIGIINAGNPSQAYQDAFNIAFVNQDDENRDAAATLAAGVAASLVPDATVDAVIAAMEEHASWIVRRAITLTMDLVEESVSVDDFAARFYARMLDWTWPNRNWDKEHYFSGSSLEVVPVTMALLDLCDGDVNQAIIEGASFGRDCDTIARAVGCVAGALHGAGAIRNDWIQACEEANRPLFEELEGDAEQSFFSVAERLVEALRQERETTRQRLELMDRILEE
jgi:ADP-ribosylglycohydrolase